MVAKTLARSALKSWQRSTACLRTTSWDIRNAHRKDTTTADISFGAVMAQETLTDVMSFKGSEKEMQIRDFFRQLGIDYDKLTKEKFVTLIGIPKKIALLKSPYNQRGQAAGERRD